MLRGKKLTARKALSEYLRAIVRYSFLFNIFVMSYLSVNEKWVKLIKDDSYFNN